MLNVKFNLTNQEKELNELIAKLWLNVKTLNLIHTYKYEPKNPRREVEDLKKSFERTAKELKEKFHGQKIDGKPVVPVIFERYHIFFADPEIEPVAVLRELEVENGSMKVTVDGKRYTVILDKIEDYRKTVSQPVFKAIERIRVTEL